MNIIAKLWNEPRCLSKEEWVKKMWAAMVLASEQIQLGKFLTAFFYMALMTTDHLKELIISVNF